MSNKSKFFEVPIYKQGIILVVGDLEFLSEVLKTKVSESEAREAVSYVKNYNGDGTTSAHYDDWRYNFYLIWSNGDIEGMIREALFVSDEIVRHDLPSGEYPWVIGQKTQAYVVAQCLDLLLNNQ